MGIVYASLFPSCKQQRNEFLKRYPIAEESSVIFQVMNTKFFEDKSVAESNCQSFKSNALRCMYQALQEVRKDDIRCENLTREFRICVANFMLDRGYSERTLRDSGIFRIHVGE